MERDVEAWVAALDGEVESWEVEQLGGRDGVDDAFSGTLSFGTGGIRALMGIGPNRLNRLTVGMITAGLATYLLGSCDHVPTVVVAYDTRTHSRDFAATVAGTLSAAGVRTCVFREPQPTPVLSFAVRHLGADVGVVITASHNPKEYNGYKVYGPTGGQATPELATTIQDAIAATDPFAVPYDDFASGMAAGRIAWVDEQVTTDYLDAVRAQSTKVSCRTLSLAYSPLNGTGTTLARQLLERLGPRYSLVEEQSDPDGSFPTCPRPNPELLEAMSRVMGQALADGAGLALATDPDADRLGVAASHDGTMRLLSGDEVGLLLLDFLCRVAPLPPRPVAVTTIVSSPLLDAVAAAHSVELRRTLTGFKYIGEQVDLLEGQGRLDDFLLGIEESLGYLRGGYVRDKDGLLALMLVSEMAAWHASQGRDLVQALAELHASHGFMASRQLSVATGDGMDANLLMASLGDNVPREVGGLPVSHVTDYLQGVPMPGDTSQRLPPSSVLQYDLEGSCRVILRPSGTEPIVKAYCFASGKDDDKARASLESLTEGVRQIMMGGGVDARRR